MENLSAASYASTGTCWCGKVRANRLKHAFSYVFLSPSFACEIFWGGAEPWYFTALEAALQKFHGSSRIPFLGILKGQRQEFVEVMRGLLFDL